MQINETKPRVHKFQDGVAGEYDEWGLEEDEWGLDTPPSHEDEMSF